MPYNYIFILWRCVHVVGAAACECTAGGFQLSCVNMTVSVCRVVCVCRTPTSSLFHPVPSCDLHVALPMHDVSPMANTMMPQARLAVLLARLHSSQRQAQTRQLLLARESQPWDQQARRHPSQQQAQKRQLLLARESQPWDQQARRHPSQQQARTRQLLLARESQPWAQHSRRHPSQQQARTRQLILARESQPWAH